MSAKHQKGRTPINPMPPQDAEEVSSDDRRHPTGLPSHDAEALLSALASLEHTVADLSARLTMLEGSSCGNVIADLIRRLEALETPVSHEIDISNAKNLRRLVKGLAREQKQFTSQLERTAGRSEEAVRLAEAAARLKTTRTSDGDADHLDHLLPALDQVLAQKMATLTTDLHTSVEEAIAHHMHSAHQSAKDKKSGTEQEVATTPAQTPTGLQEDILLVLARYGNAIKNLAHIEHDNRMEKQDIEHVIGRVTSRAVQDMCHVVIRYTQPVPTETEEDTPLEETSGRSSSKRA